jgi:adenylate kinase family enzyme
MPFLGPSDPLPHQPRRILIGGTSGSGKTTLATALAAILSLPHTEMDGLHHGPNWTVRDAFLDDVRDLARRPTWITEYQYADARPILLEACDLVVYLALPRRLVTQRVIVRTVRRSLRREVLWNGNVEPPLRTIFTDPDHIIRWAWKTHQHGPERIADITRKRPDLPIVVLRSPREVTAWLRRVRESATT